MLPDYRPFYFVNNPEAFRLFKGALSAITDIKNKIVNCLTTDDIEQSTGSDTAAVMSQAAITTELNKKLNIAQGAENEGKIPIVNSSGNLELADELAKKLNIAQGVENEGKIPTVNSSGNLELADTPSALHNYSTTEQVVGTWENSDGTVQPLYEKTIYHTQNYDGNSVHYINIPTELSNIQNMFLFNGYAKWGGVNGSLWGDLPLNFIHQYDSNEYYIYTECIAGSNNSRSLRVRFYASYDQTRFSQIVATIRYTKTTDTPVSEEVE